MSLLEVNALSVFYRSRNGRSSARDVAAVNGVSFHLEAGERLGLVGESGCGKSSLCLSLMGLHPVDAGTVLLDGHSLTDPPATIRQRARLGLQMVFQDPGGSLDPRMRVGHLLDEALRLRGIRSNGERLRVAAELLEQVGLGAESAGRFPHAFSGGQRQRIALARALAMAPRLLMADEPVSALDVCVQVQVLELLRSLQRERGFALLFVAHDLAVVRMMCPRALVMYRGSIVEAGPSSVLFSRPCHPYTRALLDAVPDVDRALARRAGGLSTPTPVGGDGVQDGLPRNGCPYVNHCRLAIAVCHRQRPALTAIRDGHCCACFVAGSGNAGGG